MPVAPAAILPTHREPGPQAVPMKRAALLDRLVCSIDGESIDADSDSIVYDLA